jgi:hypothetical protein
VRLGRGRRIVVFVAEPAVASVVPVSLLVSMGWRVSTRTVDCSLEHERQTSNLLGPPRDGRFGWLREGVSDQLERDPFAGLGDQVAGLDASDQDSGLGGGEVPF